MPRIGKRLRKVVAVYEAVGTTVLLASLLLLVSVYVATNQNPNYAVTLYTNHYGENFFEVVLLIVSIPAGFLVLFHHGYELLKPTIEASNRRVEERKRKEQETKQR